MSFQDEVDGFCVWSVDLRNNWNRNDESVSGSRPACCHHWNVLRECSAPGYQRLLEKVEVYGSRREHSVLVFKTLELCGGRNLNKVSGDSLFTLDADEAVTDDATVVMHGAHGDRTESAYSV